MGKKSKRRKAAMRAKISAGEAARRAKINADKAWYASLVKPQPGQDSGWGRLLDLRRNDFLACDRNDTPRRVYCLVRWNAYMHKTATEHRSVGPNFLTRADKQVFLDLMNDPDDLSFCRMIGTLLLAQYHHCFLEFGHSLHCCIEALNLCLNLPADERDIDLGFMKTLPEEFGNRRPCVLGDFLPGIEIFCNCMIKRFHLDEVAGGLYCDVCGKANANYLERMKSCSRCVLSFYCSDECSKRDWPTHKKRCRKKGQYKVNDTVYSMNPNGRFGFGSLVRIIGPGQTAGTWEVSDDSNESDELLPSQMNRCRPSQWITEGNREETREEFLRSVQIHFPEFEDVHRLFENGWTP